MLYHSPRFLFYALALGLFFPTATHATSEDASTESLVEASNLSLIEGTGGVTPATFIIKLKYTPSTSGEYVEYELLSRTATLGEDYEPLPAGRLDFAAGETEKTLTVNVMADDRPECPENFVLRLQHWFHGKPMDVTATIIDDDGGDASPACPEPVAPLDTGVVEPVHVDAHLDGGIQSDTGAPPIEDPPTKDNPVPSQGSGCSLSQGSASSSWLLAMLGLLTFLFRRRDRR